MSKTTIYYLFLVAMYMLLGRWKGKIWIKINLTEQWN